jgi:hypothetical protein
VAYNISAVFFLLLEFGGSVSVRDQLEASLSSLSSLIVLANPFERPTNILLKDPNPCRIRKSSTTMSDFGVESGDDDLPTSRDISLSCKQVLNDFLGIVLLLLRTCLQTLVMFSTVTKSIQNIQNVAIIQMSKVIYFVTIQPFSWKTLIYLSDVYNIMKFMNRFFVSILISFFVLSLKETYVWLYFVENLIVPIITVAVPLQLCIYRQLIGPPFMKQSYVTSMLWFCNSFLVYYVFISFLSVNRQTQGQPESRTNWVNLLALMEVPFNLIIVSWRALEVKNINYTHFVKNSLVVNVLSECMSPIFGFIICCRSRSGLLYPMLYLQQLCSWGNSIIALATYVSYEHMISDTFHLLTEAEVNGVSDDDVCPVCLMAHSTDSCLLACNHLVHSACLISMIQV